MAKCARCRDGIGVHSWSVNPCAINGKLKQKYLCDECDIELNDYVLAFFRINNRKTLMEKYRWKVYNEDH